MRVLFFWVFFILPIIAMAGGPILVTEDGAAVSWESPVSIHPEGGECGPFSNVVMLAKIETNLNNWSGIAGAEIEFDIEPGTITEDVDEENYRDYIVESTSDPGYNDDVNPVLFDDSGEIVAAIFGDGNQNFVLGFAGPDGFSSDETTIIDGQAVFNCRCLENNPGDYDCEGVIFTTDDLDFTMVHEMGHMIGLDHTQVNDAIVIDCDTAVEGDCDDLPTMYPQSVDAADQITPQEDDIVSLLTLYGLSTLENNDCAITGNLTDSEGNPLRCADVQATTSDTADTIAIVSGVYAPWQDTSGDGDSQDEGECLSNCGLFFLPGIDPAKSYTITVKPIDDAWVGGSSLNPCISSQISGIVEEEIATLAAGDCVAGSVNNLGTLQTLSTGGTTEGEESDSSDSSDGDDSSDDDSGNSSSAATGLQPLIPCSLMPGSTLPYSSAGILFLISMGLFLLNLRLKKGKIS